MTAKGMKDCPASDCGLEKGVVDGTNAGVETQRSKLTMAEQGIADVLPTRRDKDRHSISGSHGTAGSMEGKVRSSESEVGLYRGCVLFSSGSLTSQPTSDDWRNWASAQAVSRQVAPLNAAQIPPHSGPGAIACPNQAIAFPSGEKQMSCTAGCPVADIHSLIELLLRRVGTEPDRTGTRYPNLLSGEHNVLTVFSCA